VKAALPAAYVLVGISLALFFDAEGGGDVFVENVSIISQKVVLFFEDVVLLVLGDLVKIRYAVW
jgi:hypothetical protein